VKIVGLNLFANYKLSKGLEMKKFKMITVIIVSALAVIIFIQNTESVETKILFMKVTMSRALLLILTFLIGFVSGTITTSLLLRKSTRQEPVIKNT
jgi:uncharacterized integral membrane protein